MSETPATQGHADRPPAMHVGLTPLFDLEAVGLGLTPTEAMKRGEQVIHQCAWCGCAVVWHKGAYRRVLGLCPACGRDSGGRESDTSQWWSQQHDIAGLRRLEPAARDRVDRALRYLEQTTSAIKDSTSEITWTSTEVFKVLTDVRAVLTTGFTVPSPGGTQ